MKTTLTSLFLLHVHVRLECRVNSNALIDKTISQQHVSRDSKNEAGTNDRRLSRHFVENSFT